MLFSLYVSLITYLQFIALALRLVPQDPSLAKLDHCDLHGALERRRIC